MDLTLLLTFALLAVYMVFVFRSQKKSAQKRQDMMNALQVGSKVVTIGGLHGVVSEVHDTTVVLDCEGIYLTFERVAISRIEPTNNEHLQSQLNNEAVQSDVEVFETETTHDN